MMKRNDEKEEMRDEWDKCFSSMLDGLKKDEYYLIFHNMLQYYSILHKNLHRGITSVHDGMMKSSSSRVVIFQHGQDVSIGRNYHFIPSPKEPFTIHLGFRVII